MCGYVARIVYRIDPDAIVLLDVFTKKTSRTPKRVVENCRRRLRQYDVVQGQKERDHHEDT